MPILFVRPSYSAGTRGGGTVPSEGIPGNHWGATNSQYDQDYFANPLFAPNDAYNAYQLMRPTYGEYQGITGAPLSGSWPPPQDLDGIREYLLQQRNWTPYYQYPRRVGNTPPTAKRAMWLYFDWTDDVNYDQITAINGIFLYTIQRRFNDGETAKFLGWRVAIYEHTADFPAIPPDNPLSSRFANIDVIWGGGILPNALANNKFYASTGVYNFLTEPTGGPFELSKRLRYWVYLAYIDNPSGPGFAQGEHQFAKIWMGIDAVLGGTPAPGTGPLSVPTGYSG